jgi:predicted RNase H-like nuclease (RuvC/YqgF family)
MSDDNMNGKRPLIIEKSYKEEKDEKEEKLKDLSEKNEKLEKEVLKMNFQIKSLEDKLKIKSEKEYVVILLI